MAVRVKNVPPGLEPGIYKVAMTRVKNRRNFVELEAQLLLETVRRPKARVVQNELGVDVYKVNEAGGEVRAWHFPDGPTKGDLAEFLQMIGVEVLE